MGCFLTLLLYFVKPEPNSSKEPISVNLANSGKIIEPEAQDMGSDHFEGERRIEPLVLSGSVIDPQVNAKDSDNIEDGHRIENGEHEFVTPIGLTDPQKDELLKGECLVALVQDESGIPLEGVEATYYCQESMARSKAISTTEGKITLQGLSRSTYLVTLHKEGFSKKILTLELTESIPSPTWTLLKGGSLQVTVLNVHGQLAEGIKVTLQKLSKSGGYQQADDASGLSPKRTNPIGQMCFDHLEAGNYRASVRDDIQGIGVSEDCVLKESETVATQIILSEGLTLGGKIIDAEQKPIPHVKIEVTPLSRGGSEVFSSHSDMEGKFAFKGLNKGQCRILLNHNDYESKEPYLIIEAGKDDLTLEMQRSRTISVLVKTHDQREPQTVSLFIKDSIEVQIDNVKTNEGRYQFKSNQLHHDKQRIFRVIAKAKGYNPGISEEFTLDTMPEKFDIILQEEKSIKFNLTNTMGEALNNVSIHFSDKAQEMLGGGEYYSEYFSDAQGEVVIKGLPEGEMIFTFKHSDYSTLQLPLIVSNQNFIPHAITLNKGSILKGTVKDSGGEIIKGIIVLIQMERGILLNAMSDDLGRYIIKNIPSGEGYVNFSRDTRNSSDPKPTAITFVEGETVVLDWVEPEIENTGRLEVQLSEKRNDVFNVGTLHKIQSDKPMSISTIKSKSSFIFEKVPEGEYRLHLFYEDQSRGFMTNRKVSIVANKTTMVRIDRVQNYRVVANFMDGEGKFIRGQCYLKNADTANNNLSNPLGSIVGLVNINHGKIEFNLDQPGTYQIYISTTREGVNISKPVKTILLQQEGTTDLGTIIVR